MGRRLKLLMQRLLDIIISNDCNVNGCVCVCALSIRKVFLSEEPHQIQIGITKRKKSKFIQLENIRFWTFWAYENMIAVFTSLFHFSFSFDLANCSNYIRAHPEQRNLDFTHCVHHNHHFTPNVLMLARGTVKG